MTTKKRDKSSYPGRPRGSMNQTTVRKLAIKQLENVLLDANAPTELKTQAALRLTETQT